MRAAELGAYRSVESDVSYVSRVGQMLPRQSARQEERMREAHARLEPSLSSAEAEARFLARSATFDTYALDPFAVKVLTSAHFHTHVFTCSTLLAARCSVHCSLFRLTLSLDHTTTIRATYLSIVPASHTRSLG